MTRRDFLQRSSALASAAALSGCAHPAGKAGSPRRRPDTSVLRPRCLPFPPSAPISTVSSKITVCTRPFRAQGPRIEAERLGDKLVVHNYGHGGSGWSLSWGSGTVALELALAGRDPFL